MKKILQLTKAIILTLAAVIMLLNTNVLTAYAGTMMFPGMTKTEDGRIMITNSAIELTTDSMGREWWTSDCSYPYRIIKDEYEVTKFGITVTTYDYYLDCYLTDYIEAHEESEWPSFVIMGSDGIPFYYSKWNGVSNSSYAKFCYDKELGYWREDKAYKGPSTYRVDMNDLIEETKTKIENGEEVNGAPTDPRPVYTPHAVDSDDVPAGGSVGNGGVIVDKNGETVNPPKEDEEIKDPYADINTLGATVTLKTDCIKVKTNKKGVVAQKPLPKSVKVGKKALKRNKTFTVSYEKYTDGWKTVDAVTDEGIYRLVVTGKNGYEGVCTKRLYVTAEKSIKAMSSVSVKVNKVDYTGNPIESGVIKTAKIGKRTLVENYDYTATYTNNTDSGTAQVTLTAKEGSGLLGTKTVNFTIKGNKISKVKVAGISSIIYNPNETIEQDMSSVKLTYNGTQLTKDTDFTVSYVNNTKAGTAKIVFTGKGLYYGTLTKSFKITKAQLSESMLDDASKKIEVTYTGKAIKPEVTLKNGDTTLKKGTDYTLTYKNNVKVSTDAKPAQITVKGKGSYTGSFKVNFAVIAKSNGIDEKSNAKTIKSDDEDDNLTDNEAVVDEPTEDEAVSDEPTDEESVTDEPTDDESVTDAPADDEPVTDEPTEDEPATDEPTEKEPEADEPTGDEPATDETPDTEDGSAEDETSAGDGNENETGDTDSEETGSTAPDNADNVESDDTDDTISDNAVTTPETQSDEEPSIPENSVPKDADNNTNAAQMLTEIK